MSSWAAASMSGQRPDTALASSSGKRPSTPVGQVVVGAGLFAHPDADAGEGVGPQPGDDALKAVVAACRPGRPDAQLAGGLGDVVAQDDDVIGRDLEKGGQGGRWNPPKGSYR